MIRYLRHRTSWPEENIDGQLSLSFPVDISGLAFVNTSPFPVRCKRLVVLFSHFILYFIFLTWKQCLIMTIGCPQQSLFHLLSRQSKQADALQRSIQRVQPSKNSAKSKVVWQVCSCTEWLLRVSLITSPPSSISTNSLFNSIESGASVTVILH